MKLRLILYLTSLRMLEMTVLLLRVYSILLVLIKITHMAIAASALKLRCVSKMERALIKFNESKLGTRIYAGFKYIGRQLGKRMKPFN